MYAGLMPSEMKRLRQLEEENAKLKRIVADLSLDKAMLQDVLSMEQDMWQKWVFIASSAGITSLMRGSVGDIV